MGKYEQNLDRDASYAVIGDGIPFLQRKSRTFTGASGLGAQGTTTLFTVTGSVMMDIFAVCGVRLEGASATIALGVSGQTAGLINTATATAIDAGFSWTTQAINPIARIGTAPAVVSSNVIETIATADITAGSLYYYCFWRPLSANGNVVAA